MKPAVICLAAGYSRRFQGNKLLYPFLGKPLFLWTLEALGEFTRRCGGKVFTVTQYPEIAEYCQKQHMAYLYNAPETNTGKASSIRKGLEAAGEGWDCYFFQVADQPGIDPEILEDFWNGYLSCKKGIGCVCDQYGKTKNPVIFSNIYRNRLLTLKEDEGGRGLIKQFPEDVWKFPVKKESFFYDIDTRADLLRE